MRRGQQCSSTRVRGGGTGAGEAAGQIPFLCSVWAPGCFLICEMAHGAVGRSIESLQGLGAGPSTIQLLLLVSCGFRVVVLLSCGLCVPLNGWGVGRVI